MGMLRKGKAPIKQPVTDGIYNPMRSTFFFLLNQVCPLMILFMSPLKLSEKFPRLLKTIKPSVRTNA